ncbi:unnamed protein product [Meganyctiphanes norvegica]|uniref:Major facilitator superfamily (MFS) profile domain-containing protein n=1 Tax=Meganyctiphanes norvegica TaxID=48144 RepID=A0AAV2PWH4_MEGNR
MERNSRNSMTISITRAQQLDILKKRKPPPWKEQGYLPGRYVIASMAFLGMIFNYMLRVNINFVIIAMVKAKNETNETIGEIDDVCGYGPMETDDEGYSGTFEWDEWTQSLITGSFYWGYIWTQIPGGRLAEMFGAQRVYGGAMTATALFSLLTPVAANWGYASLIVVRVLMGVAEGMTFPPCHVLLSRWAPPTERSLLCAIIIAGCSAGTIITYPMAASIIQALNWEAVFYIQAVMALVWCVAWFLVVTDSPADYRWITPVELEYINASVDDNLHSTDGKDVAVPWISIFKSMPFWAILVASFGSDWGFYTLLTEMPLYMKMMMRADITSNAVLTAVPYVFQMVYSLTVSATGDKLLQMGYISTTTLRKIGTATPTLGAATMLLLMPLMECDKVATMALLFVAISLQGGGAGYQVNHIDIAPKYAGTLYGITNAAATIPGWVAPMTVGALTNNQQTFEQWRKVFYISAAIYMVCAVFYITFASGVEQPWNTSSIENKYRDDQEEGRKEKVTVGKTEGQINSVTITATDKLIGEDCLAKQNSDKCTEDTK